MNGSQLIQSANGGAVAFTTTHWSVVLDGARRIARGAERRWKNSAALIGGRSTDSSGDKALGSRGGTGSGPGFFCAACSSDRDLNAVRKEKGRLRSYLLASLKHFLASERHRAHGS